jgi:probable HAF family extracellular repeat protein
MQRKQAVRISLAAAALLIVSVGLVPGSSIARVGPTTTPPREPQRGSVTYVADFVSAAATGADMNDAGDVTGTSYPDPGCGPFCLPPLETVVWRSGERIVLPDVPGFDGITARSINNLGWVAGLAGLEGSTTHAVVWKPDGDEYQAIDLGVLPGTTASEAVGIDNLGRVVGWSTSFGFPFTSAPFMWSEATGMIDLSAQGFPDEPPLAISPGGAVATQFHWYRLGDPSSVVVMPPPPNGFAVGGFPTTINDAGDQARFLISTSTQRLRYLFRFHHEGVWQQISFNGFRNLPFGVGSISADRDVTATVAGVGVIAFGLNGVTQPMVSFLSSAYKDRVITFGGPINSAGQVLAQVMVGRSVRLMRLVPATGCVGPCIKVSSLQMKGRFVQDPSEPGQCTLDGEAFNVAIARVVVTDQSGARVAGAVVEGRFLDDYWTNRPVSGQTNAQGVARLGHRSICGVGAMAFLVEDVTKPTFAFDRTVGVVTDWVIPQA